jgi:hypothetical protein
MLKKLETASARLPMRLMTQKQFVRVSANTYGKLLESVKSSVEQAMPAYPMKQCARVMDAAFRLNCENRLHEIQNRTFILLAGRNKRAHRQGMVMRREIPNAELNVTPARTIS